MKLDELQKVAKITWNKFYVCRDVNSWTEGIKFEVTADEFLEFAKQDYKNKDKKGLIGTITNCKRAIDCQIDWIISYLGYDYINFNEKKYLSIISIINDLEDDEKLNKNYSLKLRFIQVMEIAPTFLISQIREIRSKLEHEYVLPSEKNAKEAIEIAELFINATQNKLFNKFFTDYIIQNEYDIENEHIKRPYYSVRFNLDKYEINIYCKTEKKENINVKFKSSDKEYIFFLKAGICHDFYYLVKAFGCDINREYVNYEIIV